MVSISLSLDALSKLGEGLRRSPAMVEKELLAAMAESTMLLERETKEAFPKSKEAPVHPDATRTPKRIPGKTAESIHSDYFSTPAGVLGVVGSDSPIAAFVELGTRPHTIRPKDAKALAFPLGVTAAPSQLGVRGAFTVTKSVEHPGTAPQRVFEETAQRNMGQIIRCFEEAADTIARNLMG